MAHLALYREYRPQRFSEVVGQEHITRTLRNALVQGRLHHAYLLSGPRGTGKTTVARILAKAVNCLNPQDGEPCNECAACRRITSGEALDLIEIDAASNRGIDEIRDLRDKVNFAPVELKYKVYIIDEVHMLTEPAFNALLKTLEEPPPHVLFILATTEKQKLPITILSRCQAFDYRRLSVDEIVGRLQEVCARQGLKASPEALTAIARHADGGMRDALSLLDQVMAYAAEGEITLDMTLAVLGSAPLDQFLALDDALLRGDVGAALLWLDEMVRAGKDLRQLVRDYLAHLRDLLLVKLEAGARVLGLPPEVLEQMRARAEPFAEGQLIRAIRLLGQAESDLRLSPSPRLLVEVALIRLTGLFTGGADEEEAEGARGTAAAPARRRPGAGSASGARVSDRAQGEAAGPAAGAPTTPAPGPAGPPPWGPSAGDQASPGAGAGGPQAQAAPAGAARAEVPGEAAAPPAAPGPVGAGVERVVEAWDKVLALVRKARTSTYHLLSTTARIGGLRGSRLYLVANSQVFAQLLRRPEDKRIIEKALERVGLGGIEVEILAPDEAQTRLAGLAPPGSGTGGEAGGEQPKAEGAEDSPLMERLRSLFPPELIQEEDDGEEESS